MVYGTDPFSAQQASDATSIAPSIFGALPYPGSAAALVDPPLQTLLTFRFTLNPSILDCSVVGPNNERYYHVATAGQATLVRAAAGQHVAVVEWLSQPTVEALSVGAKQAVGQWLGLSADRRSRIMVHNGIHYSWTPLDRFLHLFAPGQSEWLARVTKNWDAVVLELTPRAIEFGLIDVTILATILLLSGKTID